MLIYLMIGKKKLVIVIETRYSTHMVMKNMRIPLKIPNDKKEVFLEKAVQLDSGQVKEDPW